MVKKTWIYDLFSHTNSIVYIGKFCGLINVYIEFWEIQIGE